MELIKKIEALLFVAGSEGISVSQIKKMLYINKSEVLSLLGSYKNRLESSDSALKLSNFDEVYKLTTKEEMHELLSMFVDNKPNKLSSSALETLSIIAYKSPITRVEIEDIRGVDCTLIISKLVNLNLIEESGRAQTPGAPILYKVTNNFMDSFNLQSLSQLPELDNLEESDIEVKNIYETKFTEESNG